MTKVHRLPKSASPAVKQEISNSPMRARPRDAEPKPVSEFHLGPFLIRVSNKQHYRLYSIYVTDKLIGRQASYPSIFDCIDKMEKATSSAVISHSTYEKIINNREVTRLINERSSHASA